ncbi:hypothetical protein HDU67_009573 [Dinochytrium kinnereticum]|nr:hypothetical protein HDU67_009573 [Dinochytrium kinnereticum]
MSTKAPLPPVPADLFTGLVYYLNPLMGMSRCSHLRSLLAAGGAKEAHTSDAVPRFDLRTATYVFTHEMDFPEAVMLDRSRTDVVTVKGTLPEWVYSAVRLGKLPDAEFFSADPSKFLSGMVVTCTEEIKRDDQVCIYAGVSVFGGQFRLDFEDDVTHLIAESHTSSSYSIAMEKGLTVVLPHYFDDCLRIRRRLDAESYRFPDPPLLSESPFELILSGSKPSMKATEKQFLKGQGIFIDSKVVASLSDVYSSLKLRIEAAGGKVLSTYDKVAVTAVVVLDRQSRVYFQAEADGKYVGSARWLRDTLETGVLSSPRLRALHYPQPEPLPEFQEYVICISNYSGKAREDIETMVLHLGGVFTKNMTPRNTHLICAKPFSDKFSRVEEWDIIATNHLWLEETYVEHKLRQPSRFHYQYYPSCLPLLVGETHIPDIEIERSLKLGQFPRAPIPPPKSTRRLQLSPKATTTSALTNQKSTTSPPSLQKASTATPLAEAVISSSAALKADLAAPGTDITPQPFVPSKADVGKRRIARMPTRSKSGLTKPDVEKNGRVEKTLAVDNGKTQAVARKSKAPSPKLLKDDSVVIVLDDDDEDEEDSVRPLEKKRKAVEGTPRSSPRASKKQKIAVSIIATGVKIDKAQHKGIQALGGHEAKDVQTCTHLIANKIARTEKFLLGILCGKEIVTVRWIDESIHAGRWLDPDKFRLSDSEAEERLDFSLSESIERARNYGVFYGYNVYITPQVKPDEQTLKRLIEAGGGRVRRLCNLSS